MNDMEQARAAEAPSIEPDVQAVPAHEAAVVLDHPTGRVCITPILMIDFYAGWP